MPPSPPPEPPLESSSSVVPPHGPRLSRRGLTILLLVVAVTPVAVVLYLWKALPPVQQQPLPAVLERVDAAAPSEGAASREQIAAARVVQFRNASDQPWTNLSVSLNGRFYFHRPGSVAPGESVKLFLHRFALRSGAAFDAAAIDVDSVEIAARLPSGARAIFEAPAPFADKE